MTVPVGLVLCTIGDSKPLSQQRMTLELQTQQGKYFSVSLHNFINYYAYNYPVGEQCGEVLPISVLCTMCILWILGKLSDSHKVPILLLCSLIFWAV